MLESIPSFGVNNWNNFLYLSRNEETVSKTNSAKRKLASRFADDNIINVILIKKAPTSIKSFIPKVSWPKEQLKNYTTIYRKKISLPEPVPQPPTPEKPIPDVAWKYIGYFAQKQKSAGFPWIFKKPVKGMLREKQLKCVPSFFGIRNWLANNGEHLETIAIKEAIQRLVTGQKTKNTGKTQDKFEDAVIFQPMMKLQLGITPPKLQHELELRKGLVQDKDKEKGQMDIDTGGFEVEWGKPSIIENFDDLELFYNIYEQDETKTPSSDIEKTSRALFRFISTQTGEYPWRIIKCNDKESDNNFDIRQTSIDQIKQKFTLRVQGIFKTLSMGMKVVATGMRGAMFGGVIGTILGALTGNNWGNGALLGSGICGTAMGLFQAYDIINQNNEIDPLTAIKAIAVEKKPIILQEKKRRKFGLYVPFLVGINLGGITFLTPYGEKNYISGIDELQDFSKIMEDDKEEEKKADALAVKA